MASSPIDDVLRDAVEAKRVPGVAAAAATADREIYAGAFGTRALPDGPPVTLDTVFAVFSMTKALTSAAAMQQVEQSKLSLDAPISAVLPPLATPQVIDGFDASGNPRLRPAKSPITLRQLLTHSAGYGYDTWNSELARALPKLGLQRMPRNAEELARFPLVFDPGTRWNYGINTDLVGLAVEAASGQRLHHYIRDHICRPLGMTSTSFVLDDGQRARLTRVHARQPDGSLAVVEWPVGGEPGYCMGGGGISSTARDYLIFLRALLNGGALNGQRILKPETVAEMGRNSMGALEVLPMRSGDPVRSKDCELYPGMVKKWGLGFLINTQAVPGARSANSLAWAGLGNTYFWLDPTRRVAGVILMQILPFADKPALDLLDKFERAVYAAV
ncbi:MAG: beta-lactamase family protein [Alphaproteobacteria bacterium]|nr:beta-lactamase family protein [Alphaproteobacteria bacterium]